MCGQNPGESDKEQHELRSWRSQRDQAEGGPKEQAANCPSESRGLVFGDEASPAVRHPRVKIPTPANKRNGVMQEYGYDKMNSIFMNEKVVE